MSKIEDVARETAQGEFEANWNALSDSSVAKRVDKLSAQVWFDMGMAAASERAVCDCHTWPTIAEMHEYVVALEMRLADYRKGEDRDE